MVNGKFNVLLGAKNSHTERFYLEIGLNIRIHSSHALPYLLCNKGTTPHACRTKRNDIYDSRNPHASHKGSHPTQLHQINISVDYKSVNYLLPKSTRGQ